MKIYTRTGDAGETSLFGAGRVSKRHPRIAASGAVDELNAALGVARAELARGAIREADSWRDGDALLEGVQNRLFDLGAELATPAPERHGTALLEERQVAILAGAIDRFESLLPPLKQFVLPAGEPLAAALHLARCVCRRAEREVAALAEREAIRDLPLRYLNRLGDLLFVLARSANHASGVGDSPWLKPAGASEPPAD